MDLHMNTCHIALFSYPLAILQYLIWEVLLSIDFIKWRILQDKQRSQCSYLTFAQLQEKRVVK